MLHLFPDHSVNSPLNILCLGSHSDDIEIGCGGTLMTLASTFKKAHFSWVVFSAEEGARRREAVQSAHLFLKSAKSKSIVVHSHRTSYFPYYGKEIKDSFETLKRSTNPDLIFTHYRHDRHQDHRIISDLTWNTWRNHLILEYEIPKYDGDLGSPNCFVHLNAAICKLKIKYLLRCFQTQSNKHWFTSDTFLSLLRLRGVESASHGKYAEAFYSRKVILSPGASNTKTLRRKRREA